MLMVDTPWAARGWCGPGDGNPRARRTATPCPDWLGVGEGLDRWGAGAFPCRGRGPRRLKAGPPLRNLPVSPRRGRVPKSDVPATQLGGGAVVPAPRLPNKESPEAMRLPTLLPLVLLNLLLLAACAPDGDGAKVEAASPAATAENQGA